MTAKRPDVIVIRAGCGCRIPLYKRSGGLEFQVHLLTPARFNMRANSARNVAQ
jgi:hypothetical protein